MTRQLNKMSLNEALSVFGFESGCEITKDIIADKFRKLSFKYHPDKNPDIDLKELRTKFTKVVEAKEILLQEFEKIKTNPDANNSINTKFNSSFAQEIINDIKSKSKSNSNNKFTVYQKGKSRRTK